MERLKELLAGTPLYLPARALRRMLRGSAARRNEAERVAFYRGLIPPGALAFDIGANVGDVTEPLLRAGARVVAVEPQPRCVAQIRARSGRRAHLHVERAVVGRTEGTATLYQRPHHGASSLRADWLGPTAGTMAVRMVTLASLIARHGVPAYCKVDVEGWEADVFSTLPHPLPLVSFEFLSAELDRAEACLEMLAPDGRAEINLTLPGRSLLALDRWEPLDDFRRTMTERLAGPGARGWGDIWVRRTDAR